MMSNNLVYSGYVCRYHMYGAHVDQLNVYVKNKPSLGSPLFSIGGTQGNQWNEIDLDITSPVTYQVFIPTLYFNYNSRFQGEYKYFYLLASIKYLSLWNTVCLTMLIH